MNELRQERLVVSLEGIATTLEAILELLRDRLPVRRARPAKSEAK